MIKNNYGRIVNVASVAGKDGNANASAYSVGKAGYWVIKSLGKELADKNIAVNAVTPAGAKTRILDQMTKNTSKNVIKSAKGRFLEVEEFTSLVCWLSSEKIRSPSQFLISVGSFDLLTSWFYLYYFSLI